MPDKKKPGRMFTPDYLREKEPWRKGNWNHDDPFKDSLRTNLRKIIDDWRYTGPEYLIRKLSHAHINSLIDRIEAFVSKEVAAKLNSLHQPHNEQDNDHSTQDPTGPISVAVQGKNRQRSQKKQHENNNDD